MHIFFMKKGFSIFLGSGMIRIFKMLILPIPVFKMSRVKMLIRCRHHVDSNNALGFVIFCLVIVQMVHEVDVL